MPRFALLPLLFFAALLLACGDDDDDSQDTSAGFSPTATRAAGASPQPTAAEDKPTPEPPPAGVTDEPVRFETSDGVTISGHLYSGGGPRRKAVVLAHEFSSDQTVWSGFAQELAASGVDALTLDLRGHGETGGDQDVAKIDLDVEAAARFIASRDYPEVYLFGASMGGTASIKVASRLDLAGLVTISSPQEFMGLDSMADIATITEPKLFIAGSGDEGGAYVRVIEAWMSLTPDPKQSIIFEESAHGTALLDTASGDDLKDALFAFLEAN